mgnify:FL=1
MSSVRKSESLSTPAKALIVGAGFGGIATALRLRRLGYEVTLLDNNPKLGGRAQVYEDGPYQYDGGPTVITAPFLFDELFELYGKKRSEYCELIRVEPWYRFEFADGEKLDYGGEMEETVAEINRLSPGEGEGYKKLVDFSKRIFRVGFEKLADQPFHKFGIMLRQVPALLVLKSYLSVYSLVGKFLKDDRLRRAFSIHPLLVGGNPLDTTSIYCLIHYLERKWGVWFPRGGTGAMVRALGRLMEESGVEVRLGVQVDQVLVDCGKATGIRVKGGDEEKADLVVFDADPPKVYRDLVEQRHRRKWTDRRIERLSYSMGLFVWYFGTSRTYPDVQHHTILMGDTFAELLREIYDQKVLSDDLSLYLHRPAATDPSMAPEGCDAFYVLAPVPNKKARVDWKVAGEKIRAQVQAQLEQTLLPGLGDCLESSFFVTPDDFQTRFNTHLGSGFSIAPIFRQSAWFRFHNQSEELKNLYFCGAGTHPGAGVPGVLSSAKIVEKLVPPPRALDPDSDFEVFRSKSRTFSLASFLLPRKRMRGIAQLYFICRSLDDWADEGGENQLRDALDCWQNHKPHPLLDQYRYLQTHWGIDSQPMTELMEAMRDEQGEVRFATEKELLTYSHGVAGTIGWMTSPMLGVTDPKALKHAIDLGIAMQLTNIARDIFEDAERDRVYLPAEYLNSPITPAELKQPGHSGRLEEVLAAKARLLDLAEEYYASGEAGMRYLPLRMRIVIRWAASMYRSIGLLIRKNPRIFERERAVVGWMKKASSLPRCLFLSFFPGIPK